MNRVKSAAWSTTLSVPGDAAWFDGHFPDNPILPGVALLHHAATSGRFVGLSRDDFRGCGRVKFLHPVAADVALELHVQRAQHRLRFEYTLESTPVSVGVLDFGGAAKLGALPRRSIRNQRSSAPMIPHRGAMRLIDRVLGTDVNLAVAEADLRVRPPFDELPNAIPAWAGVELMAQTGAAMTTDRPGRGMLVSVRKFVCSASFLPAGAVARIEVCASAPAVDNLQTFNARLECGPVSAEGWFSVLMEGDR